MEHHSHPLDPFLDQSFRGRLAQSCDFLAQKQVTQVKNIQTKVVNDAIEDFMNVAGNITEYISINVSCRDKIPYQQY